MEKHSTKGSALIDSHIDKHYTNINVYSYEKCAIIMTNSNNGFVYRKPPTISPGVTVVPEICKRPTTSENQN